MGTTFTPGPWIYQDEAIRQEESGAIVAEVGPAFGAGASARRSSNVALIASAPDLLAALESILQCVNSGIPANIDDIAPIAAAAIARARGLP